MKRIVVLLALALVVCVGAAGCAGTADEGESTSADTAGSDSIAASGESTLPEGFDAMPVDGPGEAAAVAALPAGLESAKAMLESSGQTMPDLADAEPRLVAYLLRVALGDQVALFEVRADGEVHNLYAYQKPFDSGTIIWTPADMATGPSAAPRSQPEKDAVAAVEAAMQTEFGEPVTAMIDGYRFVYVAEESAVFSLEIGPEGAVISSSATPL